MTGRAMSSRRDSGFPAELTSHAACLADSRAESRPACLPLGRRLLPTWLNSPRRCTGLRAALICLTLLARSLLVITPVLRGAVLRSALASRARCGSHPRSTTTAERPTASGATTAGRKAGGSAPIRAACGLLGGFRNARGYGSDNGISEHTRQPGPQTVPSNSRVKADSGNNGVCLFCYLYDCKDEYHPRKHIQAAGNG